MDRINTLLDKIRELNQKPNTSMIEIDLMMDYTKVLYADLLEWRNKLGFSESFAVPKETPQPVAPPATAPIAAAAPVPAVAQPIEQAQPVPAPPKEVLSMPVFSAPKYPNKDIREMIGINDKYQYISELFSNNKEAYEEVINELNTFEQEGDARQWLQKTAVNQYNWNDENETWQSFNKLISSFYGN